MTTDLDPADDVHEHIVLLQRQIRVPVGHGEQHREAVGVQPLGDAPRCTKTHAVNEGLQLDQ